MRLGLLGAERGGSDGQAVGADDSAAEAAIIEAAKSDPARFGPLFRAYYEKVLTYAYRCTLNRAVAEELTSNTFFNALRALPRYRRGVPFSAWIYRIATNEIRMHWRSHRRRRTTTGGPSRPEELESTYFDCSPLESEEERREKMRAYARLHELLGELPERYRSVIILRFFEGLQYEAIAQVLGKRMGTVKSLLHRALARLRIILEGDATFFPPRHVDG
jgi:RNA polymerase sigma-70 factor, ECF subfamily